MTSGVLSAALEAYDAGLSVIRVADDGSKKPKAERIPADCPHPKCVEKLADNDEWGWCHRQHAPAERHEIVAAFGGGWGGLGIVCGAVSGGLEMLELEG